MTFLAPDAPLILLIDGTLERSFGQRIAYKGRFHDAVRSQSGHVVTSEGIHWVCLMLLVSVPWTLISVSHTSMSFSPTFRSVSQTDERCSQKAAPRVLRTADEPTQDAVR